MQINPGLSFNQLSSSTVRIGSGYRAVQISGITPPIQEFLEHLQQGVPDGQELDVVEQLDDLTVEELLHQLAPVLVSTPTPDDFVISTDQDHRSSLARYECFAPVFQQGKLQGLSPYDRRTFQQQRQQAAVQIFGLGRTGTALTKVLQDSGVGTLFVWDPNRVSPADTGTSLLPRQVGSVRSLALAQALNQESQSSTIQPVGWRKQPVLAALATVHITIGQVCEQTIQQARQQHHPYYPVVIRDDEIDLGPWVLKQATTCPLCVNTAPNMPKYPVTTTGNETVAGAHLVAGLVASEVLTLVDSQQLRHHIPVTKTGQVPGMRLNTFTRINLAHGWVQTFQIEPGQDCCAALPELKIARTSGP